MSEETWEVKQTNLWSLNLMVTREARERLEPLQSIQPILEAAIMSGTNGVILDTETLDKLFEIAGIKNQTSSGARTIASMKETEIVPASRPHGLSHYDLAAFPMEARDVDMELEVHFDITGNSITEGKMADINDAFNDRLAKLRKLIISNSNLPRRPMDIARLQAEKSRFQGRENIAVAIGLVNDPRHTKNGHLMFSIEDTSGEMSCLLMNRKGDDRSGWTCRHRPSRT